MKKTQIKRVVSIILMLCMLFEGLAFPVYAAEDDTARYAKIVAAANYSFAIDTYGTLWAWGSNSFGQLGDGTDIMRLYAVKIMEDVVCVAAGGNHTLVIKKDGSLWSWGSNNFGQLGNGTTTSSLFPQRIMENVVSVAAGINFSLAVTTKGELYAWGNNSQGQLGDESISSNQLTPVRIIDSNVVSVYAASTHAMAIKSDKTLWSWGYNSKGQVGNNTTVNQRTPVIVMEDVVHAAVGDDRSMAINSDGKLYAWGANNYGCLGDGTTTSYIAPKLIMSNVADMACGNMFSLIVKTDGSLLACGYNTFGQLGDGTTITRREPIKVLDNVAYVACGTMHSLVVKNDGSLWGWGSDSYGQMGDGTGTNYTLPMRSLKDLNNVERMAAGDIHTMALKEDKTLWIWGANTQGQLGNGTYKDNSKPQMILENVVDMDGGSSHTLAIQSDGSLWAWGYNAYGQVGNGTTINSKVPFNVNSLNDVKKVACGDNHSLAIKKDGSLWAWGSNSCGQLGNNDTNDSRVPIHIMDDVADVAAGYLHTVVLKTDGSLWTFGYNYSGQLGDGTKTNRYKPIEIFGSDVASIAAAANRTQAIMNDGSLWAWGDNTYGQVGDGTTIERTTPVKVLDNVSYVASGGVRTLAIKDDDSLWVWGAGPAGDGKANDTKRTEPCEIMTGVASVAPGYYNTFVIKKDGSIWSWGGNHRGSQGYDETIPRQLMPEGSILPYTKPEPDTDTDITSVTITGLIEPVTGAWPVDADSLNTFDNGYSITKISWSPAVKDSFEPETEYSATITLTAHDDYSFINGVTPSVNTGLVEQPGVISGDLPNNSLTFTVIFPKTEAAEQETIATPTASPGSGTSFYKELEIALSTGTEGAIIYYTTDDSDPSIGAGMKYDGAITIAETTTISAIAVKNDIYYSSTSKFTYYCNADALQEETPDPAIDFINEYLIELIPDVAYTINNATVTADKYGRIVIDSGWIGSTISMIKKGSTLENTVNSAAKNLFIPARPNKPILGKTDAADGGNNGSITGVDGTMEYKLSTASTWNKTSGTSVTGLGAGTYSVRVKATDTTFASVAANVTIADSTEQVDGGGDIGGDGIGGGGVGGGGANVVPVLCAIEVSGVELPFTYDESGKVKASPTNEQMQDIIKNTAGNIVIFDFSCVDGIKLLELELDPASFAGSGKSFDFVLDGCSLEVPYDIFVIIRNMTNGKVVFSISRGSVDVSIAQDGKEISLYSFQHPMIVSMDFTPPQDISTHQIVMTDAGGNVIPRSWYHNGKVFAKIYETGKYDVKIVGLTDFDDSSHKWMSEAVSYVAARGIVKGVGSELFAPDTNVTRGQFISMLMRLLNIKPQTSLVVKQFDDVEEGAYYYDALLHAKALGLVSGVGENMFNPDTRISRQDMFVMLYRAMDALGMLPEVMTEQWFEYNDWDDVASYASGVLQDLSRLGLVSGHAGNINPAGTATRAEAVQVLYNLLKMDIK